MNKQHHFEKIKAILGSFFSFTRIYSVFISPHRYFCCTLMNCTPLYKKYDSVECWILSLNSVARNEKKRVVGIQNTRDAECFVLNDINTKRKTDVKSHPIKITREHINYVI